jgi:hypothetical protein
MASARWRNSKRPEIGGEPKGSPGRIVAQAEMASPPHLRYGELGATGRPADLILEQVRTLENNKEG